MADTFHDRHTPAVIGNAVKVVLLALVLLLLAAVLGGYWLIGTSAGTRWLWDRATPLVPGELVAETMEGSIASGLDLRIRVLRE